jgi:flagellar assembly protein FliH
VSAEGKRRADVVQIFDYPDLGDSAIPDWELWGGGSDHAAASPESAETGPQPAHAAQFERRLAEETRRSFEAGRLQGLEQGRAQERASQGTTQQHLATQLERLQSAFSQERDRYLRAVESEVVKLALAISARILRREAQMDPLLLTGAARVALGQLAASTRVTLRVPPAELDLWKESIALLPNLAVQPQVAPGAGMRLGDCILETELGTADLGVRAQLSEIERGFFDRANSPASREPALAAAERAR